MRKVIAIGRILAGVILTVFGSIMMLFSITRLFIAFEGFVSARAPYDFGYSMGTFVAAIVLGILWYWLIRKGLALMKPRPGNDNP